MIELAIRIAAALFLLWFALVVLVAILWTVVYLRHRHRMKHQPLYAAGHVMRKYAERVGQ